MPNPNANAYPPLKPIELHLLLALAQEEQHGYGLVQSIERATNGVVTLDPGNFYRVIKRLLADGLIAEAERRRAADVDHERRRYYRITALGKRVLAGDLRRLHALVKSPAVRTIMREWAT